MSNRQQRRLQQKQLRKQGKGGAGASALAPALTPIVTAANKAQAMQAAVQHHGQGRLREAEAVYRQVLSLEPDNADALGSLSVIEHAAGHHGKALELIEAAIAARPTEAGFRMNYGAILEAAKRPDDAASAYRKAIELKPDYPDPYHNLGDIHLKQGKPDEAVAVFDDCMAAKGREFHALAYKAHALIDAGRMDEADRLLDFDTYIKPHRFEVPEEYDSFEDMNAALSRYVKTHPSLQAEARATRKGKHTGELIKKPLGPMEGMVKRIDEAVRWYKSQLPDDPDHPAVRWAPEEWRLTAWGVVMMSGGHEAAHIHPNGWLSGVFYVNLPEVIGKRGNEGYLEFGKPTPDLHVKTPPALRHYKPELGQMFLFPSYLYHGTVPFKSDERRICIAFDVEPIYRSYQGGSQ